MPPFNFVGFQPFEIAQHRRAASACWRTLFPKDDPPRMRGPGFQIIRDLSRKTPIYVVGSPLAHEMIILNSGPSRPWQFTYQFAHELGHFASQARLRFPRADGLNWIEEMLCECYSLIAMRAMMTGDDIDLREGASQYDTSLHSKHRETLVDRAWLAQVLPQLRTQGYLSEDSMRIARYVFDRVSMDRIVADNRLLPEVAVNLSLNEFLTAWETLSGSGPSVPSTLAELAG